VIEGGEWPNLRFQETIDETAVKIKSLRIRSPRSCSLNPRPRDREAIALHAQAAHDIQVFAIAKVVIAGDIPIVAVLDFMRSVREPIPNGFALAVFIPCALDLIRGRRSSPPEVLREGDGPSCCRFRGLRKGKRVAQGGSTGQREGGSQKFPARQRGKKPFHLGMGPCLT